LIGYGYKILRNPNYMQQGIYGICYHFIYLIKDEVMDKVPKQPTNPIEHTQTKTNKTSNTMKANNTYYDLG
jgi:hypothetical protein